jgi:hypothetical protein
VYSARNVEINKSASQNPAGKDMENEKERSGTSSANHIVEGNFLDAKDDNETGKVPSAMGNLKPAVGKEQGNFIQAGGPQGTQST